MSLTHLVVFEFFTGASLVVPDTQVLPSGIAEKQDVFRPGAVKSDAFRPGTEKSDVYV